MVNVRSSLYWFPEAYHLFTMLLETHKKQESFLISYHIWNRGNAILARTHLQNLRIQNGGSGYFEQISGHKSTYKIFHETDRSARVICCFGDLL